MAHIFMDSPGRRSVVIFNPFPDMTACSCWYIVGSVDVDVVDVVVVVVVIVGCCCCRIGVLRSLGVRMTRPLL